MFYDDGKDSQNVLLLFVLLQKKSCAIMNLCDTGKNKTENRKRCGKDAALVLCFSKMTSYMMSSPNDSCLFPVHFITVLALRMQRQLQDDQSSDKMLMQKKREKRKIHETF